MLNIISRKSVVKVLFSDVTSRKSIVVRVLNWLLGYTRLLVGLFAEVVDIVAVAKLGLDTIISVRKSVTVDSEALLAAFAVREATVHVPTRLAGNLAATSDEHVKEYGSQYCKAVAVADIDVLVLAPSEQVASRPIKRSTGRQEDSRDGTTLHYICKQSFALLQRTISRPHSVYNSACHHHLPCRQPGKEFANKRKLLISLLVLAPPSLHNNYCSARDVTIFGRKY